MAQTPVAGFNASGTQGCAPFSVDFTNTSTGAVSYSWNFGNGNFSTLPNPQNVFVMPGTYTVVLTATSASGQTNAFQMSITALPGPNASFNLNELSGCENQSVFNFTNTTTGAVSIFWDFDDGTSSLQNNPQKVYDDPGVYNVSLLATNAAGCQSVYNIPQAINVHPVPTAGFSVNLNTSCNLNEAFQFTNTSVGASSYVWNFGDGTSSTAANPAKIYASPGVYSVSLISSNAFGCADTVVMNNLITIHQPVSPQITASVDSGCSPLVVHFTNNINNATSYAWNFGNGFTSTTPGQFVTYQNPGNFNPTLTVTMANGCSYQTTTTSPIEVYPNPVVNFTIGNSSGCAPLTITLDNLSSGGNQYLWYFTDNTNSTAFEPSKTFTEPGTYGVRLNVTNEFGCSAFHVMFGAVTVVSPTANFVVSDTTGCPPLNVQFTNTSSNAASVQWLFGNGTTSTSPNPSVTFTENGFYDVQLIAIGSNGCRDTLRIEDQIEVSYQEADYTTPPDIYACAPFSTNFNINDQPGSTFLWSFGDGTTAEGNSVSHTYNEDGTYVVSLLIDNGSPCMIYYENYQTIHIEGGIPRFQVEIDPCPPHLVHFTDTSQSNAVSWLWNFGDGTTSTEESPVHNYPNEMVHHVSLSVVTELGCTNSYIAFNAVNFAGAFASFTSSYIVGDFPLEVSFESTNPYATGWLWDFGDGNTSTEQNPVHVYQVDGDYNVTLTIQTNNCSLTSSGSAFADEAAEADEGEESSGGTPPNESAPLPNPLIGCAPLNVSFYKQDSTHTVLIWHFGDGNSSTQEYPNHLYTEIGDYNVYYVAQTPYGIDTFAYNQSILIGGGTPTYTSSQEGNCESLSINLSLNNPAIYETIHWHFGDGDSVLTPQAEHTFTGENTSFTVELQVTDTLGCFSSSLRSFQVSPQLPIITFPNTICMDTVVFQNNMANVPGYEFFWEFGDGTTSTDPSPEHFYVQEGEFEITLTVTSPGGCSATLQLDHSVISANPVPTFTMNGPTEGCAPLTTIFVNTTPNVGNTAWFWPDGTWALGGWNGTYYSNPVTKTFTVPGVYGFHQRITSSILPTCVNQVWVDSVITVYGAQAEFSFNQSGLCLPITANFVDESVDAVSWNWNFGNGITSTEQNPTIQFTTEPADSVTLTIVNSNGCTDSYTGANISVFEPQITAQYSGICNPLQVAFSATVDGMISWEWNFGDGTTASGPIQNHVYTADGTYTATVVVTTTENCRDTVRMDVPILVNGPQANFNSPTPANCAPSVVEFFDLSEDAVAWYWDFGDNTNSTVQHPVKLYDQPGVYDISLVVTSAAGCTDTLFMPEYVTVLGPATAFTASATSTCLGAPIQFTDLSNGSVEWEWNFGEGTSSSEQNPSFTYTEIGSYVVTLFSRDTLGCSAFYTIPLPIEIYPFPGASFTISDTADCAPLAVQLTNTSQGATSYQWNFGGAGTSTETNPSFVFSTPGTYAISLIATTEFGCSDTTTLNGVQSWMVPVAGFNLNETEGCTPLSVTFNNTSYQTQNPSYNWIFGNGGTSNEVNPTHVYYDPGFYSVELQVSNANGCSDTLNLPAFIQVFDTLPAPPTPLVRVSVTGGETVIIEWEESLAPDFGQYELYHRNQNSTDWQLLTTITDPHTLTYTQSGLNTFDNVYCYRLVTRDRCGYSVDTENLTEHCTINVESFTREDNTIDVNWSPYLGKVPNQYRVYRAEENGNNPIDIGVVPGNVTTFNDTSVYCPETLRYFVTAEGLNNQDHVYSDSDYDLSDPIDNLFENQRVDMARSTVVEDAWILTEWPEPNVMAHKVTGYEVYRSLDNQHFTLLTTVPAYQHEYLDHNVNVHKQKYYYAILATNSCNLRGIEGETSDNIVLKAEAGDDLYIHLEWTPYLGWGAHGVGFYMIERQNSDGSWEVIKSVGGTVVNAVDEN